MPPAKPPSAQRTTQGAAPAPSGHATPPPPWQDTPPVSARVIDAITRIGAVMRAGVWQAAASEHLPPVQADILDLLAARPEGVRLSWLATQLSVSAASASDSVASLVGKGLVAKVKAADDGRAVALRLTPAGRKVQRKLTQALSFGQEAVAALPEGDQAALFAQLLQLIAQLQRSAHFPALRSCPSCRHFRAGTGAAPHHCTLVDAPLPVAWLRLDCPEHAPRDAAD